MEMLDSLRSTAKFCTDLWTDAQQHAPPGAEAHLALIREQLERTFMAVYTERFGALRSACVIVEVAKLADEGLLKFMSSSLRLPKAP
jgi:hypothetical protein